MPAAATQEKDTALIVPDAARKPLAAPNVGADAGALMKIIDRAAMDPNFDPAKLSQLLDVKERWDREEARKAFIVAMVAFKAEVPEILKSKAVSIPGGAAFKHAELATVCDAVVPALSRHGFAHRWEVNQEERLITVTCVLTHERGHETRMTLQGYPDDSGKKNAIQQVGSTVTYLERYTLMAATGLAAKGMDNDGNGAGSNNGGTMEEKAVADFIASIDEARDEDELKRIFGRAWNAADNVKDKKAQERFMAARDKRRATFRQARK
jgi:hypothetical protein